MSTIVRKSIPLPADLARRLHELRGLQAYWSRKARHKAILTEKGLARFLRAR